MYVFGIRLYKSSALVMYIIGIGQCTLSALDYVHYYQYWIINVIGNV